jgi:hypothetical protein
MSRGIRCFVAGVGLTLLLVFAWSRSQDSDAYECEKTPILSAEGDDYWGYIERHCEGNLQNAADDVVSFYGPTLMPGRVIYLPTSDECELQLVLMPNGNEYVYETCP